jgi:hypothetical protein
MWGRFFERFFSSGPEPLRLARLADQGKPACPFPQPPVPPNIKDIFNKPGRKREGYWRQSIDEKSKLPWPTPDEAWAGRDKFLCALERAESFAAKDYYMGYSQCRICKGSNGTKSHRLGGWDWPEGFRHYVAEHGVRPTAEFEEFINSMYSM